MWGVVLVYSGRYNSFSNVGICCESEKQAIVRPKYKQGKSVDELES